MTRKLERSTDKLIFGVAGGLAEYFQLDPMLVRLALLIMMFLDGSGTILITYFVAAWMMPKADQVTEKYPEEEDIAINL